MQPNDRTCIALLHALFFAIGGVWSVLHRRSFEAVSGPKIDYWLVRTVGGLLTTVGIVLAGAALRDRITPEIRWLAIGTSGVLTAIDVIYTAQRRIRPVYLLDAAANLALIAGWLSVRAPADSRARGKDASLRSA